MHTFGLIKAILHGVDFYWRKFITFVLLVIVVSGGIFIWRSQSSSEAAIEFAQTPQYAYEEFRTLNINVDKNGKVLIDGKNASNNLKIYPKYYEIRLLVFDNPGAYINSLQAYVHLPAPVKEDEVEQIVYAVHGVNSYRSYLADPQTMVYEAQGILSQSTLTIVARVPKHVLTPPLWKRVVFNITNVSVENYLLIAGVIPLLSFLIMGYMIAVRKKDQILYFKEEPVLEPEKNINPAVAGVLIDGQVGAREIAATLIDLATRGYIYITKKGDYFSFGKRKTLNLQNLPELNEFEKALLSKIFDSTNYKSTKSDVEMRVGRHIFSRKIAKVYLEIYNEATRRGYFIKNPAKIHRVWKYTGISLFFLGGLGYIHTALFGPDPKFILFLWIGEMLAATVIIKFSGLMPIRSSYGSRSLKNWMAFRNYLKMNKPIDPGANLEDKYNKLLPYAIVFGVEADWTKRFLDEPFAKPDWYDSEQAVASVNKFAEGLFPLINFVGTILAKSHDPTVE